MASCIRIEVENAPDTKSADTCFVYCDTLVRDTTEIVDTARIPIGFNPTVEDWEETETEGR